MRLYYMTTHVWAPVILRDRRLKISTIPELNDPFELLGASVGEEGMRRAMTILYDHWSSTMGMICLTDNWHSPVMWAHYAEKHYGLCLGFDVPDRPGLITKVQYTPDKLRGLLNGDLPLFGFSESIVEQILATKYLDWSYEREYRLLAELKDRENDLYYVDFGPDLVLREVILGSRCKLKLQELADMIRKADGRVDIVKARPAFDLFRIVGDPEVPVITVQSRPP